jgi:hypothetical protein
MECSNIYNYHNYGLFQYIDKKEAIKIFIKMHYSFTYEDIIAFLNYFTGRDKTEAVKRGLVNISGEIRPCKKVYDIIGFLTVEIYDKEIRFDEFDDEKKYLKLNINMVMEDVEEYIQSRMREVGIYER